MMNRAFEKQSSVVRASIVVPTYNERRNVEPFLAELFAVVGTRHDLDVEVIFVDDNSPDGTADEIRRIAGSYPVTLVTRPGKSGLGSAVLAGFRESSRPIVGVMDADLSHDPEILPRMIDALADHDIAIGSRFESDSAVEKWTFGRKWLSILGVMAARRLTRVSDPLSGFFVIHRGLLWPLMDRPLVSSGYKILLEILCRCDYGATASFSYVFRQRTHSTSKLDVAEYRLFIKQLLVFGAKRLRPASRPTRGRRLVHGPLNPSRVEVGAGMLRAPAGGSRRTRF